jgi:polysaccharide biosynthesis/export protein
MTSRMQIRIAIAVLGICLSASATAFAQQGTVESTSSKKTSKGKEVRNVASAARPGSDWRAEINPASVNPDEYLVGEADVLHINVWKEPELSEQVIVRPDGKISLPLVSEVKVAGMTPSQIQQLLTERLKAFIVAPQVTVTVADIRSKTVYITGEIIRAGEYPMLAPMTVLQLIAKAGGVSTYANRHGIFVLRYVDGKPVRYAFDYSEVLKGKTVGQDVELRPGDTVVVP